MQLNRQHCTMEETIGADPWNLQPYRKKSVSCSPNNLRFDIKSTALKASAPVVGILTHIGDMELFSASGFVIESSTSNGKFINKILTSATILRPKPRVNEVIKDIEVRVILPNDITCKGTVSAYNFHYNIAMIEVETAIPMDIAKLMSIDDSISIDPNLLDENPPHKSDKHVLVPGDTVVALGRVPAGLYRLMVVAGEFSLNKIQLDCQELFRANFEISRHGIGGPLINCYGEVIGVNFYCASYTPFLPINIVSLWLEQLKKNSDHLVPRLGMQLSNLHMWGASYLEIVLRRHPNIFKGVVVKAITSESPAQISYRDIIIECDEKPVESILELFELIWHKVGESVDLTVLRPSDGSRHNITMTVDSVEPNQINRWPFPKESRGNLRRRL